MFRENIKYINENNLVNQEQINTLLNRPVGLCLRVTKANLFDSYFRQAIAFSRGWGVCDCPVTPTLPQPSPLQKTLTDSDNRQSKLDSCFQFIFTYRLLIILITLLLVVNV